MKKDKIEVKPGEIKQTGGNVIIGVPVAEAAVSLGPIKGSV